MTSILWFRRDLRLRDNPALLAAAAEGPVLPLFVIEPRMWARAGAVRRAWLGASIQALDDALDGRLCVRLGDPAATVGSLVDQVGARSVHITQEVTPTGIARDARVGAALRHGGAQLIETGTPYAVGPGLVKTKSAGPFQVFTPFSAAWRAHGWRDPAPAADRLEVLREPKDARAWEDLSAAVAGAPIPLPEAGEDAAVRRWARFLGDDLADYARDRDVPATDGTSRLSAYLKVGAIHPRTLLRDLAMRTGEGVERFVTELAWREFYADVLWREPRSAWHDLRPQLADLAYDEPDEAFDAWRAGLTGYPIVDAGMRQLLATGWMHNRVRMITASFLTKDLHIWWPHGARHFLDHLLDADLASNAHGWQWVAGTGTDAAPYFRIFNPTTQGLRFDPDGSYVREWIPQLLHLPGAAAHEPWKRADGYRQGYPERIVDHAQERREALLRYGVVTRRST